MKKINSTKVAGEIGKTDKKVPLTDAIDLNISMIKPINDGMNTPVPDKIVPHVRSASEEALYKQADNPLGNPDKA